MFGEISTLKAIELNDIMGVKVLTVTVTVNCFALTRDEMSKLHVTILLNWVYELKIRNYTQDLSTTFIAKF